MEDEKNYEWRRINGYYESWILPVTNITVRAAKPDRDSISAYIRVADIALQALATGKTIEELTASEPLVKQHMVKLAARIKAQKALATRRRNAEAKITAKKAAEDAARALVASKLTPEELAAFGLTAKGTRK